MAMVVVAVGAGTVSGCGAPHPGAAAVVDGDRIAVSTVQQRASTLRDAAGKRADSSNLNRFALRDMLNTRVLRQALRDADLAVSHQEATRLRQRAEQSAGGRKQLNELLIQKYGVPPAEADAYFRQQAGLLKLAHAAGARSQDQQAVQKATSKAMTRAAKKMKVSVNPRYGDWNPRRLSLQPSSVAWLNPHKPEPTEKPGGPL